MFKKVLTIMLVLVGVLALAGCKPEPDPDPVDELTTLEKISEAMDQLDLPGTASSDLVLLTSGLHDVVIEWESTNEDVIAENGTVTIPLFTEGDETVTVTAFLSLDGETLTKAFTVEVLAATEMTDAEKAHVAAVAFNGLISGNVIADVVLPTTGQHDSTVVWSSSNPDVVSNEGVVVRPDEETGNAVIILTGTVTVGTASEDVKLTFTVVAEAGATVYTDIAAMYAAGLLGDYIEFTGIVTGVFDGGYFLSDGTLALGIYAGNNDLGAALGDEIKVKGFYAVYNTLYQLGDVVSEEILSSGNANPLEGTETVVTVAELLAVDSSDPAIHGMYYTVTGTIELQGTYNNVYLVEGDDAVLIYYYSMEASLAALEAQVGKEVTITVFYYTDHGTNGPMVAFDGLAEDITINTLSDADALAADIAALETLIPAVTVASVTLPTEGPNGTTFTAWTSSDATVLGDDGAFVALGATSVTVTFTGTATSGALTETVMVDVVVPLDSNVTQVLDLDLGSYFQVTGVIYEMSYYGFYITSDDSYIFVYSKEYAGPAVVGDEVTMLGTTTIYNGLVQVNMVGDMTVNSSSNTLPMPVLGTVEGVENDVMPRGSIVTVTAKVVSITSGDYTNTYLQGVAGGQVQVYYRSNASELDTFFDTVVTLNIVTYHDGVVLFQGVAADVTTGGTYDDAASAQAIAEGLDLGNVMAVEMDLTLPVDFAAPVATIAWASDNEAVIATDGTVVRVAGSDTVVTLTATVTVGGETATRVIVCTVIDANDSDPMTVTEALAETDGPSLLVTGVVTGIYLTWGDNEVVIQDPVTGAAIYVDFDVTGAVVGDVVIVRGELETYTSNGNIRRQLDSGSLISIESSGNAVTVDAETDVAVIADAFADMKTYTTTLTVKSYDDFGYVYFTGSATRDLKFSADTFAPWLDHVYAVDDTVVITFTVMDINYDDTRIVNVQVPAPTDAELLAAAAADLEVPTPITADLTPPTDLFGVAISWASSDIAVIALDGTVTRPANGAGDVTVTLTATFSIGTETPVDVAYVVVVSEEAPPADPLFISEYIEGSSSNKAIEIYNPNAFDVVMDGYKVCLYSNGASECGNNIVLDGVTIAANGVYVITNSSANAAIAAESDATSNITYFNGDDAIALLLNDVVIDVIGEIGVDPGSNWVVGTGSTGEHTLVRNPDVTVGVTVFDPTEWTVLAQDDSSDLGSHTVS